MAQFQRAVRAAVRGGRIFGFLNSGSVAPRPRPVSIVRGTLECLEPRRLLTNGGGWADSGLLASYYNSTDLSGNAIFSRRELRIDADWGNQRPSGSTSAGFNASRSDNWSVRWQGAVVPRYAQQYTFYSRADDGIQVLVRPAGGSTWTTVINNWPAAGQAPTNAQGTYTFPTANTRYEIEVRFRAFTGTASAKLEWASASTVREVIGVATPVGINASGNEDYGDLLFADAVKQSRPWSNPGAYDGQASVDTATGWPIEDADIMLTSGLTADAVRGTYAVTFTGRADVTLDIPSNGTVSLSYNASTNTTSGTVAYSAASNTNFLLRFRNSDRNGVKSDGVNWDKDGITNLRVMRPITIGGTTSYAPGTMFTNPIKNLISKFSVIRTMNWTQSSGPSARVTGDWGQRKLPGYATQNQTGASRGVSWEHMVQFANETGKDLYINIPIGANATYVTNLARLIKFGSDGVNPYSSAQSSPIWAPLNPGLKVYVEWSNEVWNYATGPNGYVYAARDNWETAVDAVLNNTAEGQMLNYDNLSTTALNSQGEPLYSYTWANRRVASQGVAISNALRGIFGDEMMTRVRPVLMWQYNDLSSTAWDALLFLENYYNNGKGNFVGTPRAVNYYFWGGGGAWYTQVNNPNASTIDAIYNSGGPVSVVGQQPLSGVYSTIVDYAAAFGLRTVSYEGGFQVGGDGANALQKQASLDPRAQNMMWESIRQYFAYGGDLPIAYDTSSANWGLASPTLFDQNTPRLNGLYTATYTPQINGSWNGVSLAGSGTTTLNGNAEDFNDAGDNPTGALNLASSGCRWAAWTVAAPNGGTWDLRLNFRSTAASSVQVFVDGAQKTTLSLASTGGTNVDSTALSVKLEPGEHSVRLVIASGAISLNSLKFAFSTTWSASGVPSDPTALRSAPRSTTAAASDPSESGARQAFLSQVSNDRSTVWHRLFAGDEDRFSALLTESYLKV